MCHTFHILDKDDSGVFDALMRRCPTCGSYYRSDVNFCLRDQTELEQSDGIVERYQLIDQLGEGGMGVVYKARHTMLEDRIVAIKLLHHQLSQSPEVVNRFFREAKAASQVNNEHIVEVIDFGVTTESRDSFLVMEYLEGENLRDLIDREGPLPIRTGLSIAIQIAEGLHQAHKKGIIHRDLKPENVLLLSRSDGEPHVKLLDFGIAKLTELQDTHLTRAGMVVGTPAYMSPEQAGCEMVDPRTDIYALGTILYEMLTGRCPFEAKTTKKMLLCQLTQEPTPPRVYRSEISFSLESVILHTLSKDREQRPPTMLHLAYELRDSLVGKNAPVSAEDVANQSDVIGEDNIDNLDEETRLKEFADLQIDEEDVFDLGISPVTPPDLLRRVFPFIALGAGLVIGVLITGLLMYRPEKPPPQHKNRTKIVKPDGGSIDIVVIEKKQKLAKKPSSDISSPKRRQRRKRRIRRASRKHKRPNLAHSKIPTQRGKWIAKVRSFPSGAEVYLKDKLLGKTPLDVDTAQGLTLTIHRLGYEYASIYLPARSTKSFSARLQKSMMSWEVMSLNQLKEMLDKGQISKFTYNRRRAQLIKIRDDKIVKLRVKRKIGQLTEDQYQRAIQAVKESYK